MRLFVAVEIPKDVRAAVATAARELVAGVRAAKAVLEENLHVTVRFLGEVGQSRLSAVADAVGDAASNVGAARADMRGLGAFPNPRRPRIVWAGVEDAQQAIVRLESEISRRLDALGMPREARHFTPHVTIVRIREGVRHLDELTSRLSAAIAIPRAFGEVPVRSVTLFSSELGKSGPSYTALGRFPLNDQGRVLSATRNAPPLEEP